MYCVGYFREKSAFTAEVTEFSRIFPPSGPFTPPSCRLSSDHSITFLLWILGAVATPMGVQLVFLDPQAISVSK